MNNFELTKVRGLLNTAFDAVELDALCLDHFSEVYDKFSPSMRKDAKITLLVDHCRRSPKRLNRLLDIVRREKRDIFVPTLGVPFINREEEIRLILSPFAPAYYLVDGPIGYGKSRLLEELEQLFEKRRWTSAYISLIDERTLTDVAKWLTYKLKLVVNFEQKSKMPLQVRLAGALKSHWQKISGKDESTDGFVLLIDLQAQGSQALFEEVNSVLIPAIEDSLRQLNFFKQKHNRFRVIFAGRALKTEQIKKQPRPAVIEVTLFDYQTIQDLIGQHLADHDEVIIRQLSAHLFYLTGGHPGGIAQILETYQEQGVSVELFIEYSSETIWKEIVCQVAQPIYDESIQSQPITQPLFDLLAIFRYVDYSILNTVLQTETLSVITDAYDLGDALTANRLFRWEGRFLQNETTRRLFTLYLRNKKPKQFSKHCQQASNMCLKRLQQTQVQNPEKWVLEYLFQSLQQHAPLIQKPDTRAKIRASFFEQQLTKALEAFVSARNIPPKTSREEQNALKQAISADSEFCFTVNYYLRQDQYNDEPHCILQARIDDFFRAYQ